MIESCQDLQEENQGLSKEIEELPLYEFSLTLVESYQDGSLKTEGKNDIIHK